MTPVVTGLIQVVKLEVTDLSRLELYHLTTHPLLSYFVYGLSCYKHMSISPYIMSSNTFIVSVYTGDTKAPQTIISNMA